MLKKITFLLFCLVLSFKSIKTMYNDSIKVTFIVHKADGTTHQTDYSFPPEESSQYHDTIQTPDYCNRTGLYSFVHKNLRQMNEIKQKRVLSIRLMALLEEQTNQID